MTAGFLVLYFVMLGFNLKWYIPQGVDVVPTVMQIGDTDLDGCLELIFTTYGSWPAYLHFYELHLPDVWERDSALLPSADLLWDSGDFDYDGFYDLVFKFHSENPSLADGIMIFESSDSFSYPTQEVWRDTVGFALVQPISVYDVDKDGLPEIFKLGWKKEDSVTVYYPFGVYENAGNNLYDTIFMGTGLGSLSSTIAFGNFDTDNLTEFVIGNIDGYYQIWECVGNNDYQLLKQQQLPTANIKDCFSMPDADGDGKLEFVVKGFTVPDAQIHAFIFEAIGDNTYEIIKSFTFFGGYAWYSSGYSEAGDVDGDSIPEIVLEGCQNIQIIKSAGNDSFYLWKTLPGNLTGSCVRVTNDLDHNGLNEIIVSGNNYTRIYEKTPFVTWFCPTPYDTFYANDTVYPRWRLDETLSLDSLRLYWAHPQLGCHLIYQGLPEDTICQWVVPDTQSNMSNRFWLVVKGFGRYDSTYSPVFYIKRQTGIEETDGRPTMDHLRLSVYPNPFSKLTRISVGKGQSVPFQRNENSRLPDRTERIELRIYDATGRLVKSFNLRSNIYHLQSEIVWHGDDDAGRQLPLGVYFMRLETEARSIVKKVIKIK